MIPREHMREADRIIRFAGTVVLRDGEPTTETVDLMLFADGTVGWRAIEPQPETEAGEA